MNKVLFLSNNAPARYITNMLNTEHIEAKCAGAEELTSFSPTHVIVESDFESLDTLQQSNPDVVWVVRIHGDLASFSDGVLESALRYVKYENVVVAFDSFDSVRDVRTIVKAAYDWKSAKVNEKVLYLPHYYPHHLKIPGAPKKRDMGYIEIACFDTLRPLGNPITQAVAAIKYAEMERKTLRFHVDDRVCANLEVLFNSTSHQLVKHPQMPHGEFLTLLKQMDVAMQVSFSDTFNIVAADCVVSGLPIVVSPEIKWVTPWCQAEPTNSEEILLKLIKANDWRLKLAMKVLNLRGLRAYCENSKNRWVSYLNG